MYQCQQCSSLVSANTPSYSLVIQKRKQSYPKRSKVNEHHKEGKAKITDDPGGTGFEIVKEIAVCRACYDALCE
ncbi:hypothetical protein [Spartinivicinus ruber]|uniref:hypothetical protein n=1 Tax=Spartinivicinus ruber TaxID=2683272 RepID=UPI0013D39F28|nr:hypothetical protein [Spartinivicinus ruber]